MPGVAPADVCLQVRVGGEGLVAHVALGEGLGANAGRRAALGAELRLEHANVLCLITQLTLGGVERRLEARVAAVQRLLHIEEILGDELQETEQLHEVALAEPVQILL